MFDIEKILCRAGGAAEGGARTRPGAVPALAGELEGGLLAGHAMSPALREGAATVRGSASTFRNLPRSVRMHRSRRGEPRLASRDRRGKRTVTRTFTESLPPDAAAHPARPPAAGPAAPPRAGRALRTPRSAGRGARRLAAPPPRRAAPPAAPPGARSLAAAPRAGAGDRLSCRSRSSASLEVPTGQAGPNETSGLG